MMRAAATSLAALALIAAVETAHAQGSACQRMRAELGSLDGGGRGAGGVAERQRAEVARLEAYYRDIGCEGGGFGFFGRSPECSAIGGRLRELRNLRAKLDDQSRASSDTEQRRADLRAAIARDCAGVPDERPQESWQQSWRGRSSWRHAGRGGELVCVRTCDGFFFPLSTQPAGGNTPAELCQASCPNAETAVYRMRVGGDIEDAVSERGKPYTQLANASRYKKELVSSCGCKGTGQTWAQALRGAETMLAHRAGDVLVTAAKAAELSRPKAVQAKGAKGKGEAGAAATGDGQAVDTDTTGSVKRKSWRRRR
jgi:hypothetical protein